MSFFRNMYADDTVVISTGNTVNEACNRSSQKLQRISVWCEKNKIALNLKKRSKQMINGPCNVLKENCNNICYSDVRIGNVDCYMYLGVKIESI